ncbi:hypothetical protein F5Y14DRAFT_327812 [Nemania sp. NC0429]|nr:hypothetical protein F5Y14DRAFT_327812 [Nemania sp. NC0429]
MLFFCPTSSNHSHTLRPGVYGVARAGSPLQLSRSSSFILLFHLQIATFFVCAQLLSPINHPTNQPLSDRLSSHPPPSTWSLLPLVGLSGCRRSEVDAIRLRPSAGRSRVEVDGWCLGPNPSIVSLFLNLNQHQTGERLQAKLSANLWPPWNILLGIGTYWYWYIQLTDSYPCLCLAWPSRPWPVSRSRRR